MAENPLQRAHALSAQASVLLKPQSAPLASLQEAHGKIAEATELFEAAACQPGGGDEQRTLQMLVNQHRKLARHVERRISTASRGSSSLPAAGGEASGPSVNDTDAMSPSSSPRRDAIGLATATTPWPAGISTRLGMPPFAIRPPDSSVRAQTSPQTVSPPRSTATTAYPESRSLYSSSSSDESFLHLGMVPDSMDPFSRFWGMLDNMLVDISNPVAFASAPIEPVGSEATRPRRPLPTSGSASSKGATPSPNTPSSLGEKSGLALGEMHVPRSNSPTDSFYVVPKLESKPRPGPSSSATGNGSGTGPSAKTPEELALENENLRLSLDAIASHAQSLERANRALRDKFEERERMMRSVAVGVRLEAQKVKQGQDLMRSQLLASVHTPRPASDHPRDAPRSDNTAAEQASRARIRELEQEVAQLKADNEKQKQQIDKYKDKFAQLKASAKAKREARSTGGGSSKSGSTVREDAGEA